MGEQKAASLVDVLEDKEVEVEVLEAQYEQSMSEIALIPESDRRMGAVVAALKEIGVHQQLQELLRKSLTTNNLTDIKLVKAKMGAIKTVAEIYKAMGDTVNKSAAISFENESDGISEVSVSLKRTKTTKKERKSQE